LDNTTRKSKSEPLYKRIDSLCDFRFMPVAKINVSLYEGFACAVLFRRFFIKGKQYEGEYEINGTVLRVFFEGQRKAGHIRGSDPQLFARLLFIELLNRV
jgi:hypothetical protein